MAERNRFAFEGPFRQPFVLLEIVAAGVLRLLPAEETRFVRAPAP